MEKIEVPVSLGLSSVKSEVEQLRQLLSSSVDIKADSFRNISRYLDKIEGQADGLKGKMENAFKTVSGSQNFLKQYEQLLSMLKTAKDKFSSLKIGELILSDEDNQKVTEAQEKIIILRQEIKNLQSGKIGKLFDDDTLRDAEFIRTTVSGLGKDLNSLNFSQLSNLLASELKKSSDALDETKDKINLLKDQINGLSVNKITEVGNQISQAYSEAQTERRFKAGNTNYNELLENFYKGFSSYKGPQGIVKAGQSERDVIFNETNNIEKGIERMREALHKYQDMQRQMTQAFKENPGNLSKVKIKEIAEAFKFDISDVDNSINWTQYWSAIKQKIKDTMAKEGLISDEQLDQMKVDMKTKLQSLFANADLESVINIPAFKTKVSNILKQLNVGLSDSDIGNITNSIIKNFDLSAIITKTADALTNQKALLEQSQAEQEKYAQETQTQMDKIKNAQETVNNQNGINVTGLAAATKDLKKYEEVVESVLKTVLEAMGVHLNFSEDEKNASKASQVLEDYIGSLTKLSQKQKALTNVQMAVDRWMGFWQVLNMTKSAINEMKQHIQELDSVMTSISVVTNFSQEDLWGQISQYSEIARQYGVAIKGVYEVSQIYYQQGLQQNDVMTLTTETLKMARIAGLDYATAADYMTTAIRGFKLEMTDATHVTDVFSALAATTASSTEEIAVAISKTAASAAAVGASFEATSAMMATMIATTRESATNIGTALKSVISRYGEMTGDPSKTVDSEGEEMSLNRVDKALQTVGITIHDTAGQFRDFDDVMLELMEKWDSLDSLSQRYIATLMAGNRQQSRFLALVSNVDEYKKALQTAMESEGTGELQTLKTLDSIDAKIEKMKVTIQEFYTSSGLEEAYKSILDTITNVISATNDMPKAFGKIPVQALAVATSLIIVVKNALKTIIANIQFSLKQAGADATQTTLNTAQSMVLALKSKGAEAGQGFWQRFTEAGNGKILTSKISQIVGQAISLAGSSLIISGANQYGKSVSKSQDVAAGWTTWGGAGLSIAGSALSGAGLGAAIGAAGGPIGMGIGAVAGAIEGLISNLPALATGFQQLSGSMERTIELANKNAKEQKTIAQRAQGEEKSLQTAVDRYKQLQEASYSSSEGLQEFTNYINQLADSYPNLISRMDENGNYIIELETLEGALAAAREKSAIATTNATKAELDSQKKTAEAFGNIKSESSEFDKLLNISGEKNNLYTLSTRDKIEKPLNNWDELSDDLALEYLELPKYLQRQPDEPIKDFVKRLYNTVALPENTITEELDWNRDSDKVYEVLNKFASYSNLGQAGGDIENLKNHVNKLISIDSTLTYKELTGYDSLDGLNEVEIIQAYRRFQKITADYAKYHDSVSKSISRIVVSDEAGIVIAQEALSDLSGTFDYSKYGDLIKGIISNNKKLAQLAEEDTDKSTDFENEADKKTQEYLKYFKNNLNVAEYLEESLDLNNFKSYKEMQDELEKNIKQDESSKVDDEIRQAYLEQWQNNRTQIRKAYSRQVREIFSTTQIPDELLYPNKWSNSTILNAQSHLDTYSNLIKDKNFALANSYLDSMLEVYDNIGSLDTAQQEAIASIIKSLDFTDASSLDSAISILENMGPEYDNLIASLTTASTRLMYNVITATQRLQDSLHEHIEAIEKVAENAGKGVKYSEAYKNAAEIINKFKEENPDEELNFTDIYKYSDAVGGYLLTRRGLELQLSQQSEDTTKEINKVKKQAETMKAFFKSGIAKDFENADWSTEEKANYNTQKILNKMREQRGFEDFTEPQAQGLAAQMKALQDRYNELDEKTRPTWEEWIESEEENIDNALSIDEEMLKILEKNSIGMSIASIDFSKIAGGKGDHLKDTLAVYLEQVGINIDAVWDDLLQGKVDSLNKALKDAGLDVQISEEMSNAMINAQADQIKNAIEEISTESDYRTWSPETGKAIAELIKQGKNIKGPENTLKSLYDSLHELIGTVNYTIEQYNNDIVALTTKIKGIGREKATTDLLTGGFKLEEFSTYLNNYFQGQEITDYFKDGEFIAKGYEGLFELDENGEYQIAAGHTIEEVLTFFNTVLSAGIDNAGENWKNYLKSETDKKIEDLNKADTGKQAAEIISKIASGKVGARISLEGAPQELLNILDKDNDKIFEITNEAVRDNILLALDPKAFDEEYEATIKELQEGIKSERNLGQATSAMISKQVSIADAKKYITALTGNEPVDPDQYLTEVLKYEYDAVNDIYNATSDSIKPLKELVNTAKMKKASPEYISGLESTIAQLEWELGEGKYYDAVLQVVQNYDKVSDEAKRAFELAFSGVEGVDVSTIFTQIEGSSNWKLNIPQLLAQVGTYMNDTTKDMIFQIATGYMDNIGSAVSLRTKGTTSPSEMNDFAKAYNEITGNNKQYGDLFNFDEELHTYVLKQDEFIEVLNSAKEKAASQLRAAGYTDEGQIEKIVNEMALAPIREFDFSSIAEGSATEADKTTLRGYLAAAGATDIDTIMSELSKGIFTTLDAQLGDLKISDTIKRAARSSQASSMQTAINDLIDGIITPEDIATLSEYNIQVSDGIKSGSDEALSAAGQLVKILVEFVQEGAIALTEVQQSMQQILEQQWVNAGFGKGKAAIDILTDGLSISELGSFMDTWGGTLESFFDESTKQLKGPLADVFEIDKFTGELVYKSGKSAKEILRAYEQQMGIALDKSSAEYRNAVSTIVDEQIAKLDSEDFDKQAASQLSTLSSAKVGDRINVSQTGLLVQKKLREAGLTVTGGWLEVTSEQALNQALLSLESFTTGIYAEMNPEIAAEVKRIIDELKSKMNLGSALTNIIGETVDKSAGESLQLALNQTAEDNSTFMKNLGFLWDELNQQWLATDKSIASVQAQIDQARADGKDTATLNTLQASLNNLKTSLHNRQYNAVQDVVSNYQNLSEESIAAFSTAFEGLRINIRDYITTDEWGKNKVDLAALNQTLAGVGYNVNELFQQEIAEIGDAYLQNISTGISLLSNGTNNLADIGTFVESYNETMGTNLLAKNVSYYDDILKGFTIRPEFIRAYIQKQAEILKAQGILPEEKIDQWVQDNTAEFARENIDIGSFLSSERTQDDINKIGRALQTYYELIGVSFDQLNTEVNAALETLQGGGNKAVAFAKTIKPNLTESELAGIYSNAINRWNDALSQAENLIQGQIVTGELKQVLSSLSLVTPDGVVKHIDDMVSVYAAIYDKMKDTAGATTADLNNAYAKLLTTRDQKNVDTMDALENAANMSFDALAQLFNNLNRNLEAELPNLLKDNVIGLTGFGGIRIFDFASFAKRLGLAENNPEYYETYSKYADSMADFYNSTNNIIDNVAEQIKGLADAKPGKAINVSYLQQMLGNKFSEAIEGYGYMIQDGIMVLNQGADIPGLIAAVANKAAEAGQILPEQLAELADAVAEVLSQITSLITGGISGNLKNADALKLQDWATQHGFKGQLDFTQTADGLKLSNDSAKQLYNTMNNIDSIQGQIVFKALKESLIESDDSFKSISTSASEVASIEKDLNYEVMKKEIQNSNGRVSFFDKMNGNVDLYNRPILNNEDGSYSTLLTTTLDSRNYETDIPWIMNVTPITKDGKKLDDGALEEYIQKLIDGTDGSLEAILKADAKDLGLIVELADAAGKDQDALANNLSDRAEILHEISEAYEAIKKGETFDDTKIKQYQEELNLLHEIQAERATTEDASFKFMENAIPSGQNNPLNYFENWGKAWKALQTGVKEGYMAYQDWYNIITEMNNIAGVSGQTIKMAGVQLDGSMEAAAKAIQAGAKALTVTADGSIKVDLSNFGIDLAAGANSLQEGVDKGIDAIADSQIEMLNSMIQLLETIVAMEKLGDIDVEGNGIDLSEMFKVGADGSFILDEEGYVQWQAGMQKSAEKILAMADEFGKDSDLYKGLDNVKVNGVSLRKMFTDAKEGVKLTENEAKAYHATIAAFYKAMLSNDYSEDSIMASIKEVLGGTGYEGELDIGDLHLTFKQGYVLERDSEGHYIVEGQQFNDEGAALNAMAASQLEGLLGSAKDIDTKTGAITYHSAIDTTVTVDVENNKYSASFSNGGSVSSSTQAGLAAAIEAYALLNPEDFAQKEGGANAASGETKTSFTITLKTGITANVEAEVVEGEWKITNITGKDNSDLDPADKEQFYSAAEKAINKTLDVSGQIKANVQAGVDAPVVQDFKPGENATGEAVEENKEEGKSNPVSQDIINEINETKQALQDNITLGIRGVYQSIRLGSDSVRERILANAALAKSTPVIQSVIRRDNTDTPRATGTIGLAKSKGTLMGELGPELVVSKGRYFVVGQSGPEMVDLDDDAIVFNHLQTQSLLTKGMSSGRGRAVTNERNAVSFATGNVDGGPAMASASAALNALKQLRDMWEALKSASVSDLAGAGGGGGGGGGGNKIVDPKAWVKTVERWYNLTQEIAKLEKDITHEETLRSKLQSDFSKNGNHYYNSQRLSLKALREQIAAQEQLNLSRQDYYTKRIDALKNEPLGKLYTFDEQGQMHFRDDVTMNGQKGAMNFLTDLMGFDENGKANYTNEQKYNILKQYGFDEYMKYNSNGEQILLDADHSGDVTDEERETYYQQTTEAWRDRMDNFASETQSLWDSIQEGENNLLELQANQNEILQEMRDNQIAVEEDVLKAIEDMRQREIDALQDERDKLEDSTGKYIEGLSDALSKEQEMYDNQQQENDLNQQRRRLAILQRSGGSAADIANLQNEINSNERSRYFDLQQQQIDAIQQASDLQLERMDNQIELMTETLEYQKEYGLLWSEVYDVMSHSAAQITSFIMNGNSEFWAKSPLGSANSTNETLFKAEQWVGFREDMTDVTTDVAALAFATREQMKANDYKIYNDAMVKEFGSNYDSTGKYKGIFEQVYNETGDLTKASAAARAEYQKDKQAEEAKKLTTITTTTSTPAPSSTDSSSGSSNNNKCKGCAGECTKGCAYSCTGKCDKGCKGVCGTDCERGCATGCKESCKGKCTTECYSSCLGGCKGSSSFSAQTYTSSLPKKAKGGFVKHGIYELGEEGTEGVLNAHQTRILRDNILSNKPNSLITLLNTYNEAYKDGISVAPQEASGQLIIENATVNMNVEQIANDYDARRAGEQALNEMMRIARKTSAANSIRR